jgi:hypothetical protein
MAVTGERPLSKEDLVLVGKMANVLLAFSVDLNDEEAIVRRLMVRFNFQTVLRLCTAAVAEAKRQLRGETSG